MGTEFQYDLNRGNRGRYFVFCGLSYYYSGTSNVNNLEGPFRAGLGLGAEFVINGPMHVMLEGAFTYFSDGTILPLPQIGFYYYFY